MDEKKTKIVVNVLMFRHFYMLSVIQAKKQTLKGREEKKNTEFQSIFHPEN